MKKSKFSEKQIAVARNDGAGPRSQRMGQNLIVVRIEFDDARNPYRPDQIGDGGESATSLRLSIPLGL